MGFREGIDKVFFANRGDYSQFEFFKGRDAIAARSRLLLGLIVPR